MSATAEAPPVPLDFAGYGVDPRHVERFEPGSFRPSGPRAMPAQNPVPCLTMAWAMPRPQIYDRARAEIVRSMTARMDDIRRAFATHERALAITAIEKRLADLVEEQKAAEARAKSESVKLRAAILAFDRAAESAAAVAVKAAEGEAADAANRYAIISGQLPNVRSAALGELRRQLEHQRAAFEAEAVTEARRLSEEITAAVAGLLAQLAIANTAAGIASTRPGACVAHGGPSDGLVDAFAKLPR